MSSPMNVFDFTVGQKVEVVSNEQGYVGSYYEATIVSCLDNGHYVVRYKKLREDNMRTQLTETIPQNEIRPFPPRARKHEFFHGQELDAFDNDGWWVGKVTGKLPDRNHGWLYNVYFDNYNEEIWYPAKKIRIHHDWVSGQWVRSPAIRREE